MARLSAKRALITGAGSGIGRAGGGAEECDAAGAAILKLNKFVR